MPQDRAAQKSRQNRGYREPEGIDGGGGQDFINVYDSTFTYDFTGNILTATKVKTDPNGNTITKLMTFHYDGSGNIDTITQEYI